MNTLRSLIVAAGLSAALSLTSFAADAEPGFVDVGKLMPSTNGKYIEVNLSRGMLKFASIIASYQDKEAGKLLGNLQRVRVNVVDMDDGNREENVAQIESIRRKLEAEGWTQMVKVREDKQGDNVDVHVMQRGEDSIEGLVVTVIGHDGEAVFVNIVGSISADQIAKVADSLDIKPLKRLHLKNKLVQEEEA